MKALIAALAFFALGLAARADFTIVQKLEGKGKGSEITLKIKGDKIRMEATPQMTMIVDGKTGDTITLMNAQKKFLRISGEKAKAIAEMAAKYNVSEAAEKPKLIATGKKMTINGYEAEEYVGETKVMKVSYWIAPSFPDSAAIMKQLQAVIPAAWNDLAKGMMDYRDLPGFPIKTVARMSGGDEITSTVSAIRHDALSDAEFAVPQDFEEMKVPKMEISGDKSPPPAPPKP